MAPWFGTALLLAAAVSASSISEYYNSGCGGTVNNYITGSTPTYCNTQQGASIGYTLDSACALSIYSDKNCENQNAYYGSASAGCVNFPSTGGSWEFHC